MKVQPLRKLARLGLITALLAAPATVQAQMTEPAEVAELTQVAAPTVFDERVNDVRLVVFERLPVAEVRPVDRSLQLTWPPSLDFTGAERQEDGEVVIGLRGAVDTNELFEYYRRLMAAQGYVLVNVDYDVEGGGGLFGGDDFDAEHIEASFVRRAGARQGLRAAEGVFEYPAEYAGTFGGERVNLLIDREKAYAYTVHVEPRAYGGEYGVYGEPLAYGEYGDDAYGLYGPVGYGGYEALGEEDADRARIRLVAPGDARNFRLVRPAADVFRYRFVSRQPVNVLEDFYNRMFVDQGFRAVEGEIGAEGGEVIYAAGDRRVGLELTPLEDGLYEVELDFEPEMGE